MPTLNDNEMTQYCLACELKARNVKHSVGGHTCGKSHPQNVEALAKKLHEWYLEACQKPESGMDFNPAAQESYGNLKETQKFLDRYIAGKVITDWLSSYQKRLIERVKESKKEHCRRFGCETCHRIVGYNQALDTIIHIIQEEQ